jgi:hypothetical protein
VKHYSELINIAYWSSTLAGIYYYKSFNRRIKIFYFYLVLCCINQMFLAIFPKFKMGNAQFMLFFFINTYIFCLYQLKNILNKRFILTCVILSIPIVYCIYIGDIFRFNLPLFIVVSFYVILINMVYIINILNEDKSFDIFKNPEFYTNSGLIILFFTMFSSVILIDYVDYTNKLFFRINFALLIGANIVSNLFYIKAFTCSKKAM